MASAYNDANHSTDKSEGDTPTSSRFSSTLGAIQEEKDSARKKTGLTPLRPDKSPRRRLLPSGLTPIRPNSSGKKKLGIMPIRPVGYNANSTLLDSADDASILGNKRRKTGILPIRPGQGNTGASHSGTGTSKVSFKTSSNALPAMRRKSGVLPIRPANKGSFAQPAPVAPKITFTTTLNESSFSFGNPGPSRTLPFTTQSSISHVSSVQCSAKKRVNFDVSGIGVLDDTTVNLTEQAPFRTAGPRATPVKATSSNQSAKKSTASKIPQNRILGLRPEGVSAKKSILKENLNPAEKPKLKPTVSVTKTSVASQTDVSGESGIVQCVAETQTSPGAETLDALRSRKLQLELELESVVSKIRTLEVENSHLNLQLDNETPEVFDDDDDDSETLPNNFERSTFLQHPSNPDGIYKEYRQAFSFLETPRHVRTGHERETTVVDVAVQTPGLRGRFKAQLASLFE